MCDRPAYSDEVATNEIEVTPEMIEVGLATLYEFPITEPFEDEMRKAVCAVYKSMSSIRKPLREC
jgi:hypothetical protein